VISEHGLLVKLLHWGPSRSVSSNLPHTNVRFLLAEVDLGLAFARRAAHTDDVWLAARERAKAEHAYELVVQLKERIEMSEKVLTDLLQRLEELRLAIHRISPM